MTRKDIRSWPFHRFRKRFADLQDSKSAIVICTCAQLAGRHSSEIKSDECSEEQ